MTIDEIKQLFLQEFGHVSDRFHIHELTVPDAPTADGDHIWKPGVYVFWLNNQVIRVGKSQSNARKRSMDHIRENTGGTMAELKNNSEAKVILFSLKESEQEYGHWIPAIELFFERKLSPTIKSRQG